MSEKLWKCTARCKVCNKVLNTARYVPESKRTGVSLVAPLVAICEIKSHNTLSDCNIGVKLEWEPEEEHEKVS